MPHGRNEMALDECDARVCFEATGRLHHRRERVDGRALGAYFSDKGFAVRGVDRGADPARFVVAGDIVDPSPWQAQLEGCAVVVHTAAVVSNAVPAVQQWQINVLGTRRVIEARGARQGRARRPSEFGAGLRGSRLPDTVEESWPLRADGHAYVDTKVASEAVAFQAHAAGEVAVTIVRPGDVYGPGSRPWTIIPVEWTKNGRFILPAGGKGVFSPVYVDDLCGRDLSRSDAPRCCGSRLQPARPRASNVRGVLRPLRADARDGTPAHRSYRRRDRPRHRSGHGRPCPWPSL